MSYLKDHCRKIVHAVFNQAKLSGKQVCILKILPLGYATIFVYSKSMRKRSYKQYGFEKDLVCVIQYNKLERIRCQKVFLD